MKPRELQLHGELLVIAPIGILLGIMYFQVFGDMGTTWWKDSNYSHGFLIPFLSAYFVWRRRKQIKECSLSPWNGGIVLILAGLAAYMIGSIGVAHTTQRLSFFILSSGIIMFLFGIDLFLILLFPFLYLLLMIPLPAYVYDAVAFPLKNFITAISVYFLHILNFPVFREGNMIIFPNIRLEVADACSGVRSIYSMLALSITYGEVYYLKNWKKIMLALSVIPVAIVSNIVRVFGTAIVAKYVNPIYIKGIAHDFAGVGVFMMMVALLILIGDRLRS